MLNLSKRDWLIEIAQVTIFLISLTLRFLFEWNFYTNLVFDLICVCYIFGGSILSYAIRLLCKKIYKIIDKFISRLKYVLIFILLAMGYRLMFGFLKRFANFIIAGIFFLILVAGYYYQQHFRSVLGIDKNIFQGSFSNNFYAVNEHKMAYYIIFYLFNSIDLYWYVFCSWSRSCKVFESK